MICKFQHFALCILLLVTFASGVATANRDSNLPPPAQIISRMYFGERRPVDSCGQYGRLISETEALAIRTLFCEESSTDEWGFWKIAKNNGGFLALQGKGYGCNITESADPWSQSLCISEDRAPKDTALLFPNSDYQGVGAMRGKPKQHTIDDKVADANVASFILGDGIRLVGYSKSNFQGKMQIFYQSTPKTSFPIRSYQFDRYLKDAIVIYYLPSQGAPKSCLRLGSGQQLVSLCSGVDNNPGRTVTLSTDTSAHETLQYISVFLYTDMASRTPQVAIGQLYLSRSSDNQLQIHYPHSFLPEDLVAFLDGSSLYFTWQP